MDKMTAVKIKQLISKHNAELRSDLIIVAGKKKH